MTVYTTLNKIRACDPCKGGWETLLSSLGKTNPDNEPLSLISILKSNGLDDALWCTRTVFDQHRDKIVQYAIRCAENVLHIFENAVQDEQAPRLATQAAKDYLEGKNTKANLDAAVAAAWAAADAARDARAAWAAAVAAARAADAAADAARAARAADAARAAGYAADAATRAAMAADAATRAAMAADAAADAARAARDARAAKAAGYAADAATRAAEKKFQRTLFREIFGEVQP